MSNLPNELKIADEFWNFIGGECAYQDLLDIFERIGIELRPEIDDYFVYNNTVYMIHKYFCVSLVRYK